MIVVLESMGAVTLYSGPDMVSKIFVPNMAVVQAPLPARSFHSLITSPSTSRFSESSFQIRRSSLRVDTSTDMSYFADASCVLSPVPKSIKMGSCISLDESQVNLEEIVCLRDSAKKRLTIEFNNGHMLRLSLPEMYTSLLGQLKFLN